MTKKPHLSASKTTSAVSYPDQKTLVDLFAEQVHRTPDNIAVTFEQHQLTYQQLDEQSSRLALFLRQQGVAAETLVPICVGRSAGLIVGLLGILKAGGAYVPIDPDYPDDRIRYILDDVKSRIILADAPAQAKLQSLAPDATIVAPDGDWPVRSDAPAELPPVDLHSQNAAYVIYTSGSTGKPKGVVIEHRNVVRLFFTDAPLFDFGAQDVWTMFHSFCFDFSVWEMYGALLFGGRLVIVPKPVAQDAALFGALLVNQGVTVLNQTPSAFYVLQERLVGTVDTLPVRYVIFGGEALNPAKLRPWHRAYPDCQLINMYGITETTVHVTYLALQTDQLADSRSLIGTPIPTLTTYVLDDQQHPVAIGEIGELYVGGAGLAREYLHQPELTARRFVPNPFSSEPGARLYRSGDLARQLPDGSLEYMGRIDDQVKIRGYRIELGEIEHVLQQCPGVKQAVVVAKDDAGGDKRLIGYVVMDEAFDRSTLSDFLHLHLPDYMVPRLLMPVASILLTTNGKADRAALPNPDASDLLTASYVAAGSKTQEKLITVWKQILHVNRIGINDNFFELGGNSLLAVKTVAALHETHQYVVPVTKLYQFPTVKTLADFIEGRKASSVKTQQRNRSAHATGDVAVIGMAGRFPGASTVEALWTLLKEGRETIRFFTADELDPSLPTALTHDPTYVKARGILEQADQFDAHFFGFNPKMAAVMDPQQRVFLEIAWEVLEKTGYLPRQFDGSIGVWAGCGNNTYYLNNVLTNQPVVQQVGAFQAMTVNEKDFIASRTAYQLDLKGPAVSVFSACSSSLLAITQAVESLRTGQCEVALAGGASITAPVFSGHLYEEGAMLSPDGHCRPFDARAGGTVFSDGAGVVLLKPLADAEQDGDTIYAIIKGVGVNNDGGGKGSFTAPNAEGQAGAIRMALDDARFDPATISYVEAHGTATPLGDPIELDGLKLAFGEQSEKQFCAIGSIKSNMGHLTAAAGVAGFIKTTLALYHKQLPPSIGFETPNPILNLADSPFFVNTKLIDWPSTQEATTDSLPNQANPRRAGVSSFGVGGTNVHVVLEAFDQESPASDAGRPVQLVTWSAKSAVSRDAYAGLLTEELQNKSHLNLADVSFTLQTTRDHFAHRRFAVAADTAELTDTLRAEIHAPTAKQTGVDSPAPATPGDVVFLFPGQGAQYPNMGRDLYEHEAVFRRAIDDCAERLNGHLDTDIRQILYPETPNAEAEQRLRNTRYTQPALFVTEYALARLWMSWGIEPGVLCGHSVGEFVAAHLAGVFSLTDALALVTSRGALVGELPRGSMLSVRLDAETLRPLLPPALSVAAINSRKLCVVSGADEHIADFARLLDEREIPNRPLATSHAFHSAMMDPIVEPFRKLVSGIALNRPQKSVVSTLTGTWLTDAQATDPHYWATHLRQTVRFADALDTLLTLEDAVLLDVGPGQVGATLARQQAGQTPVKVLAGLPTHQDWPGTCRSMLMVLGQLYTIGFDPDWNAFYAGQQRAKVSLPTYAFERKRCWLDAPPATPPETSPITYQTEMPDKLILNAVTVVSQNQYSDGSVSTESASNAMRKHQLINQINRLLEDTSGLEMVDTSPDSSFLEIGFDSLLLTQVALTLKKEFNVPITFRQLTDALDTPARLAEYLDQTLPAETPPPAPVAVPVRPAVNGQSNAPVAILAEPVNPESDTALGLIAQQLQLLAKQVALLQGASPGQPAPPAWASAAVSTSVPTATTRPAAQPPTTTVAAAPATDLTPEEKIEFAKPFGATARIDRQATGLTPAQHDFLRQLTERYNQKTAQSKQYAQQHRPYMADPRVVSGFRPLTKEIVYPLVVNKSKGSRLWDIDGNEYIDVLNGFGSNMYGYQPDWVKQALHDQIEKGFEVGPQHELAGEVSRLLCEFTGADRVALCNTGSEAVLGAMRVARTVTGRSLIVAFSGSYHGIVDEVLVRGTKKLKSFPAASGIMPESVQNMLILDYGTDESLRIIRERAHELAAVLVEPVQSRRPEFVPIDFLKEVRAITAQSDTVLIFDEIITGFRMHPGGTQAMFGIRADLATYGKVVGAGLSIGVIAGKRQFMDALDGGFWQYGDDSVPEVGVTYFAGTFVRHPLALAAARASLQYMKDQGPALQQEMNQKTGRLADALNAALEKRRLPLFVAQFGSLWKLKFTEDTIYGELLFTLLREKGIHIWDGFPCFMTEAHTPQEIDTIIARCVESIDEMIEAGFLRPKTQPEGSPAQNGVIFATDLPPAPGARLGRNRDGNPAWFMPDPDQPGQYRQLETM